MLVTLFVGCYASCFVDCLAWDWWLVIDLCLLFVLLMMILFGRFVCLGFDFDGWVDCA